MTVQTLNLSSRKLGIRIGGAALLAVGCAVLATQITGHAQSLGGLTFFKNYFLAGDYLVAGVGLRGLGGLNGSPAGIATGTITVSGVPNEADVVAAFLYWQVVTKSSTGSDSGAIGATFDGKPLFDSTTANAGPFSVVLNQAGTAPCWSAGGGTGTSGGNILTYTYRADVRRFLTTDANDRIVANGPHVVQIPDSGSGGNGVPIGLGASLVVVYRDPKLSFKSIVLYDGGLTLNNSSPTYQLTLKGFYQPAASAAPAVTYVVGSGQPNKTEYVYFNGLPLAAGPFSASNGPSWDTRTFAVPPASFPPPPADPQYGAVVTTKIDTAVTGGDCLTPAMVGYKTEVQDTDGDGLLDIWETASGLLDPNGHALPDLRSMGANAAVKDLFVEIGAFYNGGEATYGDPNNGGVRKPAHNHMPTPATLTMLGDAYAYGGVNVHFDVGDPAAYHNLSSDYTALVGQSDKYLVTTGFRGGEAIDEMTALATACPTSASCQFPFYPGTVGWKVGYKYYRDQLLNPSPLNADGTDPCDVEGYQDGPGQPCERRFDSNRKSMFHYVLAAHFVGLPKSEYPCLDSGGNPVPASSDGTCAGTGQTGFNPPATDNPLFHTPRTVSGIGDFPGGDVMLALGGFSDASGRPVGTPYQQAGTLMHELGHNFDLGHSGPYVYQDPPAPEEPGCNPNYLSVMNYLFQLRGLFSTTAVGPQVDYSWGVFGTIDENNPPALQGWSGQAVPPTPLNITIPSYFTAWYAPQSTFTVGTPVSRHCTGTVPVASEPAMVRLDGPSALPGTIDWDLNPNTVTAPQDVNFDGAFDAAINGTLVPLSAGHSDWSALRLNQLASRRNVYGMSLGLGRDGMGRGDILGRDGMGRDGMGRDGMGRDGMGRDGMGRDGMGRDGMGRDGMGRDGMGNDGLGGGDGLGRDGLGHDWANRDVGELDAEVAAAAGHVDVTPPTVRFSTSPAAGSTGWYATSPVTVTVTASDPSTISAFTCAPALGGVTGVGQRSGSGQLTVSASTTVSCTATDGAGNTATVSSSVNIDTAAPSITITTPADGATYVLNQVVAANYACVDAGSGVASCVGTVANGANIDTGSIGSKSFTVTATDKAGNIVRKTVSYSVGYKVTLTPLKTPAQQGSAVPVIWQEQDGTGTIISDLSTVLKLESVFTGTSTPCVATSSGIHNTLYQSPNYSTGKSTLRFVSPNFQFNWDTTSTTTTGKGCYTVLIYLNDAPTMPRLTTAVQLK